MILVELYSKDDCQLCDEAKAVLQTIQKEFPFTLKEIKLIPGEGGFEEYKQDFPVVHINKRFAFKHRLNENSVRIRLQQVTNEETRLTMEDDPDAKDSQ